MKDRLDRKMTAASTEPFVRFYRETVETGAELRRFIDRIWGLERGVVMFISRKIALLDEFDQLRIAFPDNRQPWIYTKGDLYPMESYEAIDNFFERYGDIRCLVVFDYGEAYSESDEIERIGRIRSWRSTEEYYSARFPTERPRLVDPQLARKKRLGWHMVEKEVMRDTAFLETALSRRAHADQCFASVVNYAFEKATGLNCSFALIASYRPDHPVYRRFVDDVTPTVAIDASADRT